MATGSSKPTSTKPSELNLIDLADELGDKIALSDQFEVEHGKRCSVLKEELRLRYEMYAAECPAVIRGKKWMIELGAKEFERKITDPMRMYRALKLKLGDFLKVCKVSLKEIDKRISADKHQEFMTKERTGSRSINAILRT